MCIYIRKRDGVCMVVKRKLLARGMYLECRLSTQVVELSNIRWWKVKMESVGSVRRKRGERGRGYQLGYGCLTFPSQKSNV